MLFFVVVLFSEYLKFTVFSQNNDLSQLQSYKFHFLRSKDAQIWQEEDVNKLRG